MQAIWIRRVADQDGFAQGSDLDARTTIAKLAGTPGGFAY
jgi:hypothetical protein